MQGRQVMSNYGLNTQNSPVVGLQMAGGTGDN